MSDRMQVAQRANVPPFHVMDLLAAAQRRQLSHGDLVNFVAGQPSTGAPKAVRAEAKRLLDEEVLGYTVATGVPGLREAVAAHHRRRRASTWASTTSSSPPAPRAGSCSPSWRPSSRATAW